MEIPTLLMIYLLAGAALFSRYLFEKLLHFWDWLPTCERRIHNQSPHNAGNSRVAKIGRDQGAAAFDKQIGLGALDDPPVSITH